MENPSSHIVDGQVFMASLPPGAQSSPHTLLQEKEEKYSRKVFVGGLPPDIDEGMFDMYIGKIGPLSQVPRSKPDKSETIIFEKRFFEV